MKTLCLSIFLYCAGLAVLQSQPYAWTTIAGKPGLRSADGTNGGALFAYPFGVATDAGGNIYVADENNGLIKRISPAGTNWTVTTLVGLAEAYGFSDGTNSDAQFMFPTGVAVDSNTNIFVADTENSTIRKVSPSGTNWVVTTWAGLAHFMNNNDGTGGTARFFYPQGVGLDAGGNLYVADTGNNTIRRVTPFRNVTTLAGYGGTFGNPGTAPGSADGTNTNARFRLPSAVAVDAATNLYVTDTGNHTIRKIAPVGVNWVVTTLAGVAQVPGNADGTNTTARFNSPSAILVDAAGNLLVADAGNHTLRKITHVGTNWVTSTVAGLAAEAGIADGTNSDARFNFPQGLAKDQAGNFYVGDTFNNTVRQMTTADTNWVVTTLVGNPGARLADGPCTEARFWFPRSVSLDGAGNLIIADSENHIIRRLSVDTNGCAITTLAGMPGVKGSLDGTNSDAQFNYPWAAAVDRDGNVYVADTQNFSIRKVSPVGTNWVVSTVAGSAAHRGSTDGTNTSALFGLPAGIAVDNSGNVFVADMWNQTIRQIAPSGSDWVVSTIAGKTFGFGNTDGTNSDARFQDPQGLAIDSVGNLYVADSVNSAIRKISPIGTNWVVTTLTTSGEAGLNSPYAVALDNSGSLFVADNQKVVRKLTPSGTNYTITTLGGVVGVLGSADGSGSAARFNRPEGIAVDLIGNLYVADTWNDTIRFGQPIPSLQIALEDNQAIVSWPVLASNFVLESCSVLDGSSSWTASTNGVAVSGNSFVLTNVTDGAAVFFRLRR